AIANKKRDAQEEVDRIAAGGAAKAAGKISQTSIIIWTVVILALVGIFHFVLENDWIGSFIFSISIGAPGLILTDTSLSKIERERIIVIFIAAFFVIFFWACFEQAGASLTFFADEQMNRMVNIHTSMGIVFLIVSALAGALYYTLYRIMRIPIELKVLFGA